MPSPLRSLGVGATAINAFEQGREEGVQRQRKRLSEARQDEAAGYQSRALRRNEDVATMETDERKRALDEERGAREAAKATSTTSGEFKPVDVTTQPSVAENAPPADESGAAPLRTASGAAGAEPKALSGNAPAAAPAEPPKALWLRTAEAQRDYWLKQGRPERASKVVVDAYRAAVGENEARYKFEIQPQEDRVRKLNLTSEELKSNEQAAAVRAATTENSMQVAGKVWGLFKMGFHKEAIQMFNDSNILAPGQKAASMTIEKARDKQSGKMIDVSVMRDENGEVLSDKKGMALIAPTEGLEMLHKRATTSQVKLNQGQSLYQLSTNPDGTTTGTEVARNPTGTERAADGKGGEKDKARLDRLRQQARAAVKEHLFAGQTMMDKVDEHKQKIHTRAAPLAEKYVEDGVNPGDAAAKAIKEVQDQMKREAAGAGPKGKDPASSGGPSVADIIN